VSRHYELCSDECRRVQAVEAKREFDERAKGDRLEEADESAYNYWHNRWRKLKSGKHADPTRAAIIKAELDNFRKEAKIRKGAVKRGEMKMSDFTSWLAEMNDVVDKLMATDTAELVAAAGS
jgi:hypothetical protein